MTKTRVYGGQLSLEGETVNDLTVGSPTSINPLRYNVICSRCGSKSVMDHQVLKRQGVTCPSSLCGTEKARERLADTPGKARAREAAEQRRREDEKRSELQRKTEAAEAELVATHSKLLRMQQKNLTSLTDDQLYVTPGLPNLATESERTAYNKRELAVFVRTNPDFSRYERDSTIDRIGDYFARNGIVAADAHMISAAVNRLASAGMLQLAQRPAQPVVAPAPKARPAAAAAAPEKEAAPALPPGSELGWDQNGERRVFSAHEIRSLSSEAYRRAFHAETRLRF